LRLREFSTTQRSNPFPSALQVRQKLVNLDPNAAGVYNGRGIVCFRQGHLDDALQAYRRATNLDSKVSGAYNKILKSNSLPSHGDLCLARRFPLDRAKTLATHFVPPDRPVARGR
jgi:Flp pilus assembly protein TadD